jgi:hypothetical protein
LQLSLAVTIVQGHPRYVLDARVVVHHRLNHPSSYTGYEPAEMIGYSPFDLIHPDEREALQEVR